MTPVHDVAIVGAGLLGLAAARTLSALGRDFVVLEQAEIGHEGAGSKGSCRIFRLGYPDAEYVAAAARARTLWRELEAQTGRQILLPAPHLTFGRQLSQVHDAMRRAGAPCELLSQQQAAERFPQIRVDGPALLETESAVLAADQALLALAAEAGLGERLRTRTRVTGIADDGREVTLQTTAGQVTARVAIVTAGPWTAGLLAGQAAVPTRATLEQVGYLAPAQRGAPPAPIFICHGDPSPYGLPVPGSDLYKIGIHHSGPAISPDAQDQSADPALVAALAEAAERYLPGYLPQPERTERCVYDNTDDEDFILDRVGNVVIGCGTSGHGFKFGPLFGEWLAALAGTGRQLPAGRFGLARITAGSAPAPG
ncbi:MAG TPA: FAD-dependent oxidoreductase [Streptosporangiaceae bacterium]|nr:FAD-dependent oxidoreductase [Streptosporangiaceae bacterium]